MEADMKFRTALRHYILGLQQSMQVCQDELAKTSRFRIIRRAQLIAMASVLDEMFKAGQTIWVATEIKNTISQVQEQQDEQ